MGMAESLETHRIPWSIDVKRDMELVRRILLTVQAKSSLEPELIQIDGLDDAVVGRHVEMLFDAGFLEGMEHSTLASEYRDILVKDLTWDGHEFVGAISKDELWQKLKSAIGPGELAGQSLKAIKDASIAAATAYLKGKLGL
ncbi:MAG: hypothetical protein CR217_03410 [Beijerinckiaceae bacterium]|nr:MAG: hypothetical protein CR217_03410 [Beijerinckiaceae bacterium]